ncbi:hypothetical protein CWC20_17240 [Pseudoalteromonas aurantia]|uniref:Response regulatory domain-containing protein n=1 Tax=Pseudoalteromonas aurantia TaxID=43654 RepID=A0A5S3UX59_9GAMM|nr:hypothetical protein CWC19_20560 [Pseudoalteromonas aurantia]TMO71612.1 hypothetical protein CWC20_17240 [Pseudoalteromonas aurantia]
MISVEWGLLKFSDIDFLKKVRKTARTAKTPFVMASITIEQAHVVKAIQCDMSEYVITPFQVRG